MEKTVFALVPLLLEGVRGRPQRCLAYNILSDNMSNS